MRTSHRRICRARPGFTFVEVMVVLIVLTVLTVVAVPAFRTVFESEHERELNRFMVTLRQMCVDAVMERAPRRMELDFTNQEYRPLRQDDFGRLSAYPEGHPMAPRKLPDSLRFTDILPYGATGSPVTRDVVPIQIDSSGFIDPFVLHVKERADPWTVRVGFTCKPELSAGSADAFLQ